MENDVLQSDDAKFAKELADQRAVEYADMDFQQNEALRSLKEARLKEAKKVRRKNLLIIAASVLLDILDIATTFGVVAAGSGFIFGLAFDTLADIFLLLATGQAGPKKSDVGGKLMKYFISSLLDGISFIELFPSRSIAAYSNYKSDLRILSESYTEEEHQIIQSFEARAALVSNS